MKIAFLLGVIAYVLIGSIASIIIFIESSGNQHNENLVFRVLMSAAVGFLFWPFYAMFLIIDFFEN